MFYRANDQKIYLEECPDKLLIRTKNNSDPLAAVQETLVNFPTVAIAADPILFPEASAYVFRFSGVTSTQLQHLKDKLNSGLKNIKYCGKVLQNAETKAYQVYTGNLFLKFNDDQEVSSCEKFMRNTDLYVKRKLGFCTNGFFVEFNSSQGKSIFDHAETLSREPIVEYCDPEVVVKRKTFDNLQPVLGEKSKSQKYEREFEWARKMIRLDEAHQSTKGKGIKICIIDDGADLLHPAFQGGKEVSGFDLLDDSGNGNHMYSSEMHGTACASIACSSDPKTLGVAPEASLIVIRTKGLGSVLEAEAIYKAVQEGADIISCSWGPPDGDIKDPSDDQIFHPLPDHTRIAINYATSEGRGGKGCLMFFAAGNGAEQIKYDGYANYPEVMAIGAVDKSKKLAEYSDRGHPVFCCFPSSQIEILDGKLHVIYGLTTADRIGDSGYDQSDYYSLFGGTSAAAPGMAGIAALMLSIDPDLTMAEARDRLSKSCRNESGKITKTRSDNLGHGIIDAQLLIENTKNQIKNSNKKPKTMKKYALHLALNEVANDIYSGIYPDLDGCIKDSEKYQELTSLGFESPTVLIDEQASRNGFAESVKAISAVAKSGDKVVITYAGHGGNVVDVNNDEDGEDDETLVLFDGLWIDDETNKLFAEFEPGVDVLWISDSCHSGTNTRSVKSIKRNKPEDRVKTRGLSKADINKIYLANKEKYDVLWGTRSRTSKLTGIAAIKCNLITLAACNDDQLAKETSNGGRFTNAFLKVLNDTPDANASIIINSVEEILLDAGVERQNPVFHYQGPNADTLSSVKINSFFSKKPSLQKAEPDAQQQTESAFRFYSSGKVISPDGFRSIDVRSDDTRGDTREDLADAWESTYVEYFKSDRMTMLEPDLTSMDHLEEEKHSERGSKDPDEYLSTYSNPMAGSPNRFAWHKGVEYSQLEEAFRKACPESIIDNPKKKEDYPLIAHIDTGVLPDHPSLPLHFDEDKSKEFKNPTDKDKWFSLVEQQGHGHATATILAGQRFDTELPNDDAMPKYFGGFPYANVISLRISDSVAILNPKSFVKAVRFAIKQKVDVITMSMAGAPSKSMLEVVNEAYEAGITMVSAGGNSWTRFPKKFLPKTLMYPARFGRVIAAVGVQYDQSPYLVDAPEPTRAAGGKYMQSCYGPPKVMRTAMASYTPNISWMSSEKGKKYKRNGGGTSSATPQIAAAAALFIHKNKAIIERHINKPEDMWKKVQLVRLALFSKAQKNTGYDDFYGNGILKASAMMDFVVTKKVIDGLIKESEESLGKNTIDELLRMWQGKSRGADQTVVIDKNLSEMISLEIQHVMLADENLDKYSHMDDISPELAAEIMQSKYASKFLKSVLKNRAKKNDNLSRGINTPDRVTPIYTLESKSYGKMMFWADQSTQAYDVDILEQEEEFVEAAFEISFESSEDGTRSNVMPTELVSSYFPQQNNPLQLVQVTLEDGSVISRWIFGDEAKDIQDGLRSGSSRYAYIPQEMRMISLNQTIIDGERGIGDWLRSLPGKVKKLVVKIVRIVQDKPLSGLNGLIAKEENSDWKEYKTNNNKLDASKKTLLLLHGTWSTTSGSFKELLDRNDLNAALLKENYNATILGYEMSTLRKSVAQNAKELEKQLKELKLKRENITVIAFSRGCLLAKEVFKNKTKIIFAAGTLQGTPLADEDNLPKLLNRATILSSIAGPAAPVLKGAFKLAQYIAKGVVSFPGIKDQAPGSPLLNSQSDFVYDKKLHYFISANYQPNGAIRKVLDLGYDKVVFKGLANDGVTPTLTAMNLSPGEMPDEINNLLIKDTSKNHFTIFDDNKAYELVLKNLG